MIEDIKVKRILKKELTIEEYNELSETIKNRKEIIDYLIKCNIDKPNELIECLDNYNLNQVFKKLDINQINITKELIDRLNYLNKKELIKHDVIKYLKCVGSRQFCSAFYYCSLPANRYNNSFDSEILYAIFNAFEKNKDKVKQYVLNLSSDELKVFNDKYYKNVMKEMISDFSLEEQIQLYEHCSTIFDLLSENTQNIIECNKIGDNIALLKGKNENVRFLFFERNPHLLKVATLDDKRKYYDKHKNDQDFDFWNFFLSELNYGYYDLSDEQIATLMHADYLRTNNRVLIEGYNLSFDKKALPAMLKHNIKILLAGLKSFNISGEKLNPIIDSYIKVATKIREQGEFLYATRIIFNKKIILNNDAKLICKYIEKPNMNVFIQLLTNAYGEHVKIIFDKRPKLYHEDIINLEIFDKNIYETFGDDFINFYLNASIKNDTLIYLLANDERRRNIFLKYFQFYRTNLEVFDLNSFGNLLFRYKLFESLFEKLDVNTLNETEKKNLIIMFYDNEHVVASINDREKLNKYNEYRKKILGAYCLAPDEKNLYDLDKKDYIVELLTGRTIVNENRKTAYFQTLEELSIANIVKVFNIKNIIHNPKIIELIGLNSNEVALLLLIYEILKYYGRSHANNLDNVMNYLLNESSLEPYMFISVFNKIKNYYVKEFKNALTSIENMPTTQVEGINVVDFQGESYNILCSVMGLNLKQRTERKKVYGEDLLYDWLNREHSINTISTYLQTSDISVYPMELDLYNSLENKPIIFAFDSNVDVIAMGGSDISTASTGSSIGFGFISDTKIGFSDMDELKEKSIESMTDTPGKFKSEVAIKRKNDKFYTKDFNKRVMPIGIYVIGEITKEELETAKIFKKYYRKNNLGDFKIIRVDPLKYPDSSVSVNKPQEKQPMVSPDVEWYQQIHNLLNEGGRNARR